MTLSLLLLGSLLALFSQATPSPEHPAPDTAHVSGQVIWEDEAITGFPGQVTIASQNDSIPTQQVDVDSLGHYTAVLPRGTYTISSSKNYHWIGEQYIRIDGDRSRITLTVSADQEVEAPVLQLSIIPRPELLPQEGLLPGFDLDKASMIDAFIQAYMAYFEIPGASLAITEQGDLVYHQVYGVKNSLTNEPVDEKTLFEAGSVTKPLFGFLVMRLAERGVIDLDKPLHLYLPFEDVAHDERYKLITARHVLSHQTGFPNWARRNEEGQFDLSFTPGTEFRYSGEAFEYLKRAVVEITGKEMAVLVQEEVVGPLGLANTYFEGTDQVAKRSANGHYDFQPREVRLLEAPMMAFSMVTEANAFSTFLLALRNREGLRPETYEEMLSPLSTRQDGAQWGLGFQMAETPAGWVYKHGGSTSRGFICFFGFYEDLDVGFFLMTNSHMGGELAVSLMPQLLITGQSN